MRERNERHFTEKFPFCSCLQKLNHGGAGESPARADDCLSAQATCLHSLQTHNEQRKFCSACWSYKQITVGKSFIGKIQAVKNSKWFQGNRIQANHNLTQIHLRSMVHFQQTKPNCQMYSTKLKEWSKFFLDLPCLKWPHQKSK